MVLIVVIVIKMKRIKKILIVIACIVILANVPPFTTLFKVFVDEKHYRYSNSNGSFTFYEFMDRNFEMMKRNHKSCLLRRPELEDKQVYRLFTKNPLAFWRWRLYFFDERYKLPYRDFGEINKIRERENVKDITGCSMGF